MRKEIFIRQILCVVVVLLGSWLIKTPVQAAAVSEGDIFMADPSAPTEDGSIYHFDSSGVLKDDYFSDDFVDPSGLAIDGDGNLIVGDSSAFGGTGAVFKVNPVTGVVTTISQGGSFVDPRGIAIAANGDIFVADSDAFAFYGGIIKVDPVTGAQTTIYTSADVNAGPYALAIEADGDLLLADLSGASKGILRVPAGGGAGVQVSTGGSILSPTGITVDDVGDIYMSDNGNTGSNGMVIKVNPVTGAQTVISTGSPVSCPVGIAFDIGGMLLIGDPCYEPGAILRINPDTGAKSIVWNAGSSPNGIAVFTSLPPVVDSTLPVDEATNVSRTDGVQVEFSKSMDTSSLDYDVFYGSSLDDRSDGYSVAWSEDDTVLTIEHSAWPSHTEITLAINAVDDTNGNPLDETLPYEWTFTTRSETEDSDEDTTEPIVTQPDSTEVVEAIPDTEEPTDSSELDEDRDITTDEEGRRVAPLTTDSGFSPLTGLPEVISQVVAGQYVRGYGYSGVYLITDHGTRQPFLDAVTYFTWADSYSEIVWVTDATLATFPLEGPVLPKPGVVLIKIRGTARTYEVEFGVSDSSQFQLRWMMGESIARGRYGDDWAGYVIDVDPTVFRRYQAGSDQADLTPADLTSMKTREQLTILASG